MKSSTGKTEDVVLASCFAIVYVPGGPEVKNKDDWALLFPSKKLMKVVLIQNEKLFKLTALDEDTSGARLFILLNRVKSYRIVEDPWHEIQINDGRKFAIHFTKDKDFGIFLPTLRKCLIEIKKVPDVKTEIKAGYASVEWIGTDVAMANQKLPVELVMEDSVPFSQPRRLGGLPNHGPGKEPRSFTLPRPAQMMSREQGRDTHGPGPPKLANQHSVIKSGYSQGMENLVESLEKAIYHGQIDQATQIAHILALDKAKINMKLDKEETLVNHMEKEINLRVHVEDKTTANNHPVVLKVKPSTTIRELKRHMFIEYQLPVEVQKWIIGKKLQEDDVTLHRCHVNTDNTAVYLYLMSAKSVGLPDRQTYEAQQMQTPGSLPSPGTPLEGQRSRQSTSSAPSPAERTPPARPSQTSVQRPPTTPAQTMPPTRREPDPPRPNERVPTATTVNEPAATAQRAVATETRRQNSVPDNETGWECPSCTFINVPTRPGCVMCATDRPADYKPPENYNLPEEEKQRLAREKEAEQKALEAERQRVEQERRQSRLNYARLREVDDRDLVPNTEEFTCPICFDDISSGEGIVLRECLHSFCKDCLGEAVRLNEEPTIRCPYTDENYSCQEVLQEREIHALVTDTVFEKYLERGLATAESQASNSFHCKTADCRGWCVYEDEVNFFTCPVCRKQNCLTCKAIHEGQNCKQYQDDLRVSANNDLAAKKTKEMLEKLMRDGDAMKCPKCDVILQKKDGCDWIRCSICKTEICWVTQGLRWGPNGAGDISGGCLCRVNGQKCHPNCQNCH